MPPGSPFRLGAGALAVSMENVHVSVDVPDGWRIDKAPGMDRPFSGRATATLLFEKTKTFQVHIVRDPGTWDLWARLEVGA